MPTMLAYSDVDLEFWEIYDTEPALYPEDFPHHTCLNVQDSNEAVDEKMEPTLLELQAYVYAVESYRDHERYGKPYKGARRISRLSGSWRSTE